MNNLRSPKIWAPVLAVLLFASTWTAASASESWKPVILAYVDRLVAPMLPDIETELETVKTDSANSVARYTEEILSSLARDLQAYKESAVKRGQKEIQQYEKNKQRELDQYKKEALSTGKEGIDAATNQEVEEAKAAIDARIAEQLPQGD